MTYYIDSQNETSIQEVNHYLQICIQNSRQNWSDFVFLCIGSDRITGDSLGPYIGYLLSGQSLPGTSVYGTLKNPVHALNLAETLKKINARHPRSLVIAIDASLGTKKHLGYITMGNGKLYPGAGVRKKLPGVGDIFITGIVNLSGTLEQLSLQSTRLNTVVTLANTISQGILLAGHAYRHRLFPRFEPRFQFSEGRLRSCTNPSPSAAFTEENDTSR